MISRAQLDLAHAQFEMGYLESIARANLRPFFKFYFHLPIFYIRYQWIRLITSKNSAYRKERYADFVRDFFNRYFYFQKGLIYYPNWDPIPKTYNRPFVVLSGRAHAMQSLFIYQLFPFPILIPLFANLKYFRLIGPLLETTSYSDSTLPYDLPNIKTLVANGYPVLAYLNHGYVHPTDMTTLHIYEAVKSIFELDADIFFLNVEGFDRYKFSTARMPQLMQVEFVSKNELLEGLAEDDWDEIYQRITEFFGLKEYKIVR